MKLSVAALAFIAFQINSALDDGNHDDLSIEDVRREIEQRTILNFLRQVIGLDLTHLTPETEAELLEEWQEIHLAVNARRKFGVERRGLPLLIAFLLEGMQSRVRGGK